MKKVLYISFFDSSRLGGSFRPTRLVKYLPEFGWEPIILTPELPEKLNLNLRMVETPYRDALGYWKKMFGFQADTDVGIQLKNKAGAALSKSTIEPLLTFIGGVVGYPDMFRGWKPFALKAGEELLKKEKFDAMITCAPVISHIVAAKLNNKYKIPWFADFPDLWSQNHGYRYFRLRKWLDTNLEKRTLKYADALVTISEPWAEKLRQLHTGKKVYMITQGYDPEFFNTPAPKLTGKFTITYPGLIYHKWQDISGLLATAQELIKEKVIDREDLEIRFYGQPDQALESKIKEYGLSGIAVQHGNVPLQESVSRQRESQVLLLLGWNDPNEKGVYTTKLFEYLGARRPVLVCGGGKDVATDLIDKTKAGVYALTRDEMKEALRKLYLEYKVNGSVKYTGIEAEITPYSYREMARKFADALSEVTTRK